MILVKYGQGKLLRVAITCGFFTAFFTLLFFGRSFLVHGIGWWRIFGTGFGHYALAPALILGLGTFCWRTAVLSAGDLVALRATPSDLSVTTLWRTVRIPWRELESVRMERLGIGWGIQGQVHFRTARGVVRLPLRLSDTAGSRGGELVAKIERLRDDALQRPRSAAPAASPAATGGEDGGAFDADAAIARYLARKQAGGAAPLAAPEPAAPPPAAPRPVFGRKAV